MPMTARTELVMFSPLLADRADPLFIFSDATMHATCFARHPLSRQATKWQDEARRSGEPRNRICAVCGRPVLDPDDYFGTGLLTSVAANPLYEFNFVHLHRSHAGQWKRLDELRRRMEQAEASGAWQGPRLVFDATPSRAVRWVSG
jgi:hypothetical protein